MAKAKQFHSNTSSPANKTVPAVRKAGSSTASAMSKAENTSHKMSMSQGFKGKGKC